MTCIYLSKKLKTIVMFTSVLSGCLDIFGNVLSQPKHPWCKKSCGQKCKKAMLKKMQNQNGRQRSPAVDGIKIFDNDDQAKGITVAC